MNKVINLIVLYNQKINSSPAYFCLRDEPVVVFDNSDDERIVRFNQRYCQTVACPYIHLGQNVGVYRAYNYIFDYLHDQEFDYVSLFDGDSYVSKSFINEVKNTQTRGMLLPLVYSAQTNKLTFPVQKSKNKNHVCPHKLACISELESVNAGLTLSRDIVLNERFCEQYFLYVGDFEFVNRIKDKYPYEFLSSRITQDFFDHEHKFDNQRTIKQLSLFLDDVRVKFSYPRFVQFKVGLVTSKLLIYKNLKVLSLLWK